ncbi:hypothetical protein KA005_22145, partial [bacterium]|nr:hypothetical protein [bacterium]
AKDSSIKDLDTVLRPARFDVFFPCLSDGSALKALSGFFNNINLPIETIRGLKINIESSGGREVKPFYAMIKPKEECYITIYENGPTVNSMHLMHELGHAFHMDSSDDSLPIEWFRTQDKATAEGFANMFTAICYEMKWIEEYVAPKVPNDFDQHNRLGLLYNIRVHASQFLFGMDLYERNKHLDEVTRYSSFMTQILIVDHHFQEHDLRGLPCPYSCSSMQLRSWLMAACFIDSLRLSYGDDWWTGLVDMKNEWKDGNKWSAEEYYKKDRKAGVDVIGPLLDFLSR